jgi:beta-mannosidase
MQGYGIKTGAEYWRQTMPKSMGCVFWQYNDTWPGMSWASVDYFGRWKALHYMARKFYAPVLVSGLENLENGTVDIFVTSDRLEACQGVLTWNVTDLQGKSLAQASAKIEIEARNSRKIQTLDVGKVIGHLGKNEVLTWLKLTVAGEVVSENLVLLALPKQLKLSDPKLTAAIDEVPGGFLVTIKTQSPALWTWLDLEGVDAKYADNFFHVTPNSPVQILVRPVKKITKENFATALQVRSLFDLSR